MSGALMHLISALLVAASAQNACDCIATPPNCNNGPYWASCAMIGFDPAFEFSISGITWVGLGVHEPCLDGYAYSCTFDQHRYSGQWVKHDSKGHLPWCYTCGQCVGDYGSSPSDECGYWQYLTAADRSVAGVASAGYYILPQGADCLA